ncbi:pyruvate kinase alpha/beta domain-containing protein, partial [Vibrio anguillarum]|nr:pyruvate kinase [Vibrio anguillarum]
DLGVAILTQQGETPLLMSRCQSQATIWALSDRPELLRKLTILRGVTPTYIPSLATQADLLSQQVLNALAQDAANRHISSILMTQLESIEGVGNINVCRLLTLPVVKELAA